MKKNITANLSARKIITMMLKNEHTSYCQTTHLPAAACICLTFESKQYIERLSSRPRKVSLKRPGKMHIQGYSCGAKNISASNTTATSNDVTCKHCNRKLSKQPSSKNASLTPAAANPTLLHISI